jgi:anti-anti-sigma factor
MYQRIRDHGGRSLLTIRVAHEGLSEARLVLGGELDLTNAEEADEQIRCLERRFLDRLVVDVSGLRYIDTTGIALVVGLVEWTNQMATELRFTRAPEPLERVFEMAGLAEIPFED